MRRPRLRPKSADSREGFLAGDEQTRFEDATSYNNRPSSRAKFVAFTTLADRDQMPGLSRCR